MPQTAEQKDAVPPFRELYPHLTEEQLKDAEDRFDRYIALAVRVFERLRNDPTFPENLRTLTAKPDDRTISDGKVDLKNK
jgi:hypothetical protein